MNNAVGFTANYDMRDHFTNGSSVRCIRKKPANSDMSTGSVVAVTKYIVVVQFDLGRESYSYFDFRRGNIRKR